MKTGFSRWLVSVLAMSALCCFTQIVAFAQKSDLEESKSSKDSTAWVQEIAPGKKLYGKMAPFAAIGHATAFDLVPNENRIAFGTYDGVKFWDVDQEKLLEEKIATNVGQLLQYSPNGKQIFTTYPRSTSIKADSEKEDSTPQPVTARQTISVWNAESLEKITTINPVANGDDEDFPNRRNGSMNYMVISPDGDKVLLGYGKESDLYDVESGESQF